MGEVVEPQSGSGVQPVCVPLEWRAVGPKHDVQVICESVCLAEVLDSIALHVLGVEEEHWPVHQALWIQKGSAGACRHHAGSSLTRHLMQEEIHPLDEADQSALV